MHPIQQQLLELAASRDLSALSYREIGRILGVAHAQTIKYHMQQLQKNGLLSISPKGRVLPRNPELASANTAPYVFPRIGLHKNFNDARNQVEEYGGIMVNEPIKDLGELLKAKRAFVIAEPGHGKSRLLLELARHAEQRGFFSILLPLKSLGDKTLEETVVSEFAKSGLEITTDIPCSVCLDALDEVSPEHFPSVSEQIKAFAAKYVGINLYVACRWHFFGKNRELFNESGFQYIHILPFDHDEVRKYLRSHHLTEEQVKAVFSQYATHSRDLVIQVPRYLELFTKFVQENGASNIGELSRTSLMEHFIYQKLSLEDKNLNQQKRDIVKRVLEKLALVMEIHQVSSITKEELMTFFDELDSDLKTVFLNQVSIEVFYDKSLINDKGGTIQFENAEFQECLAAKELVRLGNPSQTIFELAVDPELREIYPSWYNTLSYIVDLDISLLKPLISLGKVTREGYSQDEDYHRLLSRVNVTRLSDQERKEIFESVFNHYQHARHWVSWDVARNLSYYHYSSLQEYLRTFSENESFADETERYVQLGNIATIVAFLFQRGTLPPADKNYWKEKMLLYAQDTNRNGVLQRHAISALEGLGDASVLPQLAAAWNNPDKLVRDNFLQLVIAAAPDSEESLQYYIRGLMEGNTIYAYYGFFEIKSSDTLKSLLRQLAENEEFANQILDHESIFKDRNHKIIENLSAAWDDELGQLAESFILAGYRSHVLGYQMGRSIFIRELAKLIDQKNPGYALRLVSQYAGVGGQVRGFDLISLLAHLVKPGEVNGLINALSTAEHGQYTGYQVLSYRRSFGDDESLAIYEEGRGIIPQIYQENEAAAQQRNSEPTPEQRTYREFKRLLSPGRGMYNQGVFEYFSDHFQQIRTQLTERDRDRLTNLITGSVLDHVNPGEHGMTVTEQADGSRTYTANGGVWIFGHCLEAAAKINLDLSAYREKIVSYIPFAYRDTLEAIFQLIPDISISEILPVLAVYEQPASDFRKWNAHEVIRFVKERKIVQAAPILKSFAQSEELRDWERSESLEATEDFQPDQAFLLEIFNEYAESHPQLAEKANALLISRYANPDAIEWRFTKLRERAQHFREPVGAHSVGSLEHELHDKEFALPLIRLKDPQYIERYLSLLDYSFELISQHKDYYPYGQYLWQVVKGYFDNLKELRSFEPLKRLEKRVEIHASEEGANWFAMSLIELKRSYLGHISNPDSISESIKKYNRLRVASFLPIRNEYELVELVRKYIAEDVSDWMRGEGHKMVKDALTRSSTAEKNLQKLLALKLPGILFDKGFRPKEIVSVKEPESLDDTKPDFLIYYGLLRPVVLEIKRSSHGDVNGTNLRAKESYLSFGGYLKNHNACGGIFMVVDEKSRTSRSTDWPTQLRNITEAYESYGSSYVVGVEGFGTVTSARRQSQRQATPSVNTPPSNDDDGNDDVLTES